MNKLFQTLTVNTMTGKTYWQRPQFTIEDAEKHASRYTRNLADKYIYDVSCYDSRGGNIRLVKTILHSKQEDNVL